MAFYRERDLRTFAKEVTSEGIGIGGGFIVGGAIGRSVENMIIKTPVDANSPLTSKLFAWAANNGAKFALYYLAKHYDANSEVTRKATEALAGSVVYDSVLRLANHGYNPADVNLSGYRILGTNGQPMNAASVQKLVQENSILRTELNKALQKLASSPVLSIPGGPPGYNPANRPNPDSSQDFRYAAEQPIPGPYERQTQFGAMQLPPAGSIDAMPVSPNVAERNRRYGSMPFEQHGEKTSRERKYGFSAPKEATNIGAMFNMQ